LTKLLKYYLKIKRLDEFSIIIQCEITSEGSNFGEKYETIFQQPESQTGSHKVQIFHSIKQIHRLKMCAREKWIRIDWAQNSSCAPELFVAMSTAARISL